MPSSTAARAVSGIWTPTTRRLSAPAVHAGGQEGHCWGKAHMLVPGRPWGQMIVLLQPVLPEGVFAPDQRQHGMQKREQAAGHPAVMQHLSAECHASGDQAAVNGQHVEGWG